MALTCQQIEDQKLFFHPGWAIMEVIEHVLGCEACADKMQAATKEMEDHKAKGGVNHA